MVCLSETLLGSFTLILLPNVSSPYFAPQQPAEDFWRIRNAMMMMTQIDSISFQNGVHSLHSGIS